jgi:polyisoprenoid-binding protein YceI
LRRQIPSAGPARTRELTVRDVTRPVTFEVEVLGYYAGMDGDRRVGLSARTKIDREDCGLTWSVALEAGGWLVWRSPRGAGVRCSHSLRGAR